jgi:hypothetical protein
MKKILESKDLIFVPQSFREKITKFVKDDEYDPEEHGYVIIIETVEDLFLCKEFGSEGLFTRGEESILLPCIEAVEVDQDREYIEFSLAGAGDAQFVAIAPVGLIESVEIGHDEMVIAALSLVEKQEFQIMSLIDEVNGQYVKFNITVNNFYEATKELIKLFCDLEKDPKFDDKIYKFLPFFESRAIFAISVNKKEIENYNTAQFLLVKENQDGSFSSVVNPKLVFLKDDDENTFFTVTRQV